MQMLNSSVLLLTSEPTETCRVPVVMDVLQVQMHTGPGRFFRVKRLINTTVLVSGPTANQLFFFITSHCCDLQKWQDTSNTDNRSKQMPHECAVCVFSPDLRGRASADVACWSWATPNRLRLVPHKRAKHSS